MKVRKAVIPAAGMGTRFLPATKAQPKEMLPIVDKPTIQYIVEEAIASGIEDILIVTGRGKRAIEDHFDKSYELEDILRRKRRRGQPFACPGHFQSGQPQLYQAKRSREGLAMPSTAQDPSSTTNRLRCCSATISSTPKYRA